MLFENKVNAVHKKTGNKYAVIGLVKNCTNAQDGQIMVMYESLTMYRDVHFTRELSEFLDKFNCPDDICNHAKTFRNALREFKKPTV